MHFGNIYREGKPLRLGRRLGKGGEGEVYALAGESRLAVKIYTGSDTQSRQQKVAAMVTAGLYRKAPLVAFPVSLARHQDGSFAGFFMPVVSGHKPLHDLYAPGSRKKHFPQADYRFLVRAAANIARAVASVHKSGCVIGDINHSSILVSPKAVAALIDADSFQFSVGSTNYLCRVGVPEYTPPELQGSSLASAMRTANHDAFGLAVVIFQLLFMGRHPFASTVRHGEMPPLSENIRAYRYAYASGRRVGTAPPPGAPEVRDCAPGLVSVFDQAFLNGSPRPTAENWVSVLTELEASLVVCPKDSRHCFPKERSECVWCDVEEEIGTALFARPTFAAKVGRSKLASRSGGEAPTPLLSRPSTASRVFLLWLVISTGLVGIAQYNKKTEVDEPVSSEPPPSVLLPVPLPSPVYPGPELFENRWFAPQQTGHDQIAYGLSQKGPTCLLVSPSGLMFVEPWTAAISNTPMAKVIGEWVVWPLGFEALSTVDSLLRIDATRESVAFSSPTEPTGLRVTYLDVERVLELREPSATSILRPGCDKAFDRQAIQVAFAWATELGGDYLTSVTDAIRRPTAAPMDEAASDKAGMFDRVSWPSLGELTKLPEAAIAETPPAAAPFTSTSLDTISPSSTGPGSRITKPRYPVRARLRDQEGRVTLLLDVAPSGKVDEAHISETSGFRALDRAAASEARREWRLVPGMKGGVPTRMNKEATVTFRIDEKSVDVKID